MDHVISYVKEHPDIGRYRTAVITGGEGAGRRAFLRDGGPDPSADPFFSEHYDEMTGLKDGLYEVGGRMVFIETAGRPAEIVICGGGHVSIALIKLAKMVDFKVTVFEDRPLFAGHAREAGADSVICNSFEETLKTVSGSEDTYFVIVTRGHRYDMLCLRDLLKKPSAYIGMIGSRGRVAKAKAVLREEGYTEEMLDRLYSPIGLKIGADTPAEIAVSIIAEIIGVRSGSRSSSGFPKAVIKGLETPGDKVLVTIIDRHGSAPRPAGTKMVVCADGSFHGTIGGGCAESDTIGIARDLLLDPEGTTCLHDVDMSLSNAKSEGMVCGGRITLLLEKIKADDGAW